MFFSLEDSWASGVVKTNGWGGLGVGPGAKQRISWERSLGMESCVFFCFCLGG